jgi:hypothetical protein
MATAPKTATKIDTAALAALLAVAKDPKAMAELAKQDPDAHKAMSELKNELAEAGSPRNVAAVHSIAGNLDSLDAEWMEQVKGKSTYFGAQGKISGRSFAARFNAPTDKVTKNLDKIKQLTVETFLFAEKRAKELGIDMA